jgi:uncharacterized protein (DUF934 family)
MPMPELWRAGEFPTTDDWAFPAAAEALPATGRVAVAKARFLTERAALFARDEPVGVVLESGESLDGVEDDVTRLGLVALRFPRYADGRNYSTARILRDRLGYRGELRATGDVLRDQIGFLLRAGFDALEIAHPGTAAALREGRIVGITHFYQPASIDAAETSGPRAWQRRAR